ncbi:hypothetical protein Dimus_026629 [Dionaea muscipula]
MGKSNGKKKKHGVADLNPKQNRSGEKTQKAYDKDAAVFIAASQELKEEGNKLFQRRDYEGAMLKYDKALKLLPRSHIDVAYLRSNMAACYMQMGISDYPRAIHECNLALEVSPKYSKALLKRSRCYEGLGRLELALRDVTSVLNMEPNNLTALEIAERVRQGLGSRSSIVRDYPVLQQKELPCETPPKVVKDKTRKKKSDKNEEMKPDDNEEKKQEDKVIVEEKLTDVKVDEPKKTVKLVFGEDIRWAELPINCSLLKLREVIKDRFPTSKAVLVKYKDQEGDMITITTEEELKWAEASASPECSMRLYLVEVNPEQDPLYGKLTKGDSSTKSHVIHSARGVIEDEKKWVRSLCIEEWIIQFALLFKNHVGFSSDAYLNLHELGVKLYSEAMEESLTSEEAQAPFDMAAEKFQEMAALALFNWGNVHMAQARKRVCFTEDASKECILAQVGPGYEWAQQEYAKAGKRYEEALKIKPDFYEGLLALGQQQFEQAKLTWYFALASNVDLETWYFEDVIQLYNSAEDNIEKGMQMWEESIKQCDLKHSKTSKGHGEFEKMGLDHLFEDLSANGAAEDIDALRSQLNMLLGSILYERSIVEYKVQLPVWQECLEVSTEKFELAGASATDIAVMIKNHCSNDSAIEGFRVDEIVQAWNEMDDAKRWYNRISSFRLEPLLRRRVSKLYDALEQA